MSTGHLTAFFKDFLDQLLENITNLRYLELVLEAYAKEHDVDTSGVELVAFAHTLQATIESGLTTDRLLALVNTGMEIKDVLDTLATDTLGRDILLYFFEGTFLEHLYLRHYGWFWFMTCIGWIQFDALIELEDNDDVPPPLVFSPAAPAYAKVQYDKVGQFLNDPVGTIKAHLLMEGIDELKTMNRIGYHLILALREVLLDQGIYVHRSHYITSYPKSINNVVYRHSGHMLSLGLSSFDEVTEIFSEFRFETSMLLNETTAHPLIFAQLIANAEAYFDHDNLRLEVSTSGQSGVLLDLVNRDIEFDQDHAPQLKFKLTNTFTEPLKVDLPGLSYTANGLVTELVVEQHQKSPQWALTVKTLGGEAQMTGSVLAKTLNLFKDREQATSSAKGDLGFVTGTRGFEFLHNDATDGIALSIDAQPTLGEFVSFDQLRVSLRPDQLSLMGNMGLKLGPVKLLVEQVGVGLQTDISTEGFRIEGLSVVPPRGVGISVDTPSVSGGGYLFSEPEKHRYGGAAQLQVGELDLKAVGLLSTRLPDGSKGFSLLLIISSEFEPQQIALGFTLNGVGGILGVHRSMNIEALRQGLKTGALDSVLFPDDVMGNIPKIVSDLRTLFPPTQDQHIFGPTAIIGWGTTGAPDQSGAPPTLVTGDLGLVLELPSPLRLGLLGTIRMTFPLPKAPLVDLRLDVLGLIDFGVREASLDAVLYDSRIHLYRVSGEMAFRLNWGTRPDFIFSVGGFHPAFEPPDTLPVLERLSLSVGSSDNPRLRLAAYMALTPNTLQLGAMLDLYVAQGKFNLQGQLGFDTLITFSPFGFDALMFAKLLLRRNQTRLMHVDVEMNLTGPAPWRARGHAKFNVARIPYEVAFDETFGERDPTPTPVMQVWPELEAAVQEPSSWATQMGEESTRPVRVSLKAAEGSTSVVHPGSTLSMVQRVVPLELELERFGKAIPEGERYFELESLHVTDAQGTLVPLETQKQTSQFAPGEYLDLKEDEKLSRPSFERMQAGFKARGAEGLAVYGTARVRPRDYEAFVVDEETRATLQDDSQQSNHLYTLPQALLEASGQGQSSHQRRLQHEGNARFGTTRRMGISLAPTSYAVVEQDSMGLVAGTSQAPGTYAQQAQAAKRQTGTASTQIVAEHERTADYTPAA